MIGPMNWLANNVIKLQLNMLHRRVLFTIYTSEHKKIEFGNIRKHKKKWGVLEKDCLVWIYEISFVTSTPLEYKISYHIKENTFKCSSIFNAEHENINIGEIHQFTCTDYDVLSERILNMIKTIPLIRTKVLRDHLFRQLKVPILKPTWRIFNQSQNITNLESVIYELYREKKISNNERKILRQYAQDIQSL